MFVGARAMRALLFLILCFASSACGGGGGGQIAGPPQPAPIPDPPTPPDPNDTEEFRQNPAYDTIGALAAYDEGLDGSNIIVATYQIADYDHPEFAGRIRSDLAPPPPKAELDGHGTQVLGLIGAARDGAGMHGIAPNVDLAVINGGFPNGFQVAADIGAKVISISNSADGSSVRGIHRRGLKISAPAGIVTVFSASNQGADDPRDSQLAAIDPEADGTAIIVGSVDDNNVISTFSNRAGIAKDVYMVAPGEGLYTTDLDGGYTTVSGTSFSTPIVSGSAALLFQMWPNLSAQEVVQILLTTAADLGDPGVDIIYGHGLLNLAEALSPQKGTSIPASGMDPIAVDQTSIAFSVAFGDAGSAAFSGVLFVDGWDRAYVSDFSGRIARPGDTRFNPTNIFRSRRLHRSASVRATHNMIARASYIESENTELGDPLGLHERGLGDEGDLRLQMLWRTGERTVIETGMGLSLAEAFDAPGDGLVTGQNTVPYLTESGKSRYASLRQGLSETLSLRLTAAFTSHDGVSSYLPALRDEFSQSAVFAELTRQKGALSVQIRLGSVTEKDAILGARSTGAFRIADGATTTFVGAEFEWQTSKRFNVYGNMTYGWTRAKLSDGSLFAGLKGLRSSAWRAGVRATAGPGSVTFGVSQPLRAEGGVASLNVPSGREYSTNAFLYEDRMIGLSPSSREIDLEAQLLLPVGGGFLTANLIWQLNAYHQPGNAGLLLIQHAARF